MSTRNEIKARLGILAEPPAKATAARQRVKTKMGKWDGVEVIADFTWRNKQTGATASSGGSLPYVRQSDAANWEKVPHFAFYDSRTNQTIGQQYKTRQQAEAALRERKAQEERDRAKQDRLKTTPSARRSEAIWKEIDRLMSRGMTQMEAIDYLKSRGLRMASSRPGAKAKMARPTQEHQYLLNEFKALDQGIGRLYDRVGQMMAKADAIVEHFPKDERNPDPGAIAKSMAMIKALQAEMNAMLARHKFARPGIKTKMAVNRRKVVQDLEYLRDEARRVNDASSRMDAENWLKRVRARDLKEQDWLEAADAVSQISAVLNSRPGAKAKMDKSAALAIVGKAIEGVPAGAQRDALQKALIDYYDNTQAANRLLKQGNTQDATRFAVEAGRAAQIAVRTWDRLGKPAAELRGFTQNLERAAEFARPGAKSTHAAPAQKPGRKVMAESDPAVSAKIRKLMAEGKPQKQAVAIALDMKRRGEI